MNEKRDVRQLAKIILDVEASFRNILSEPHPAKDSTTKKNRAAVALGRLGGLKGGKARAAKLSPERRKEIAQKASQARWEKARTSDFLSLK